MISGALKTANRTYVCVPNSSSVFQNLSSGTACISKCASGPALGLTSATSPRSFCFCMCAEFRITSAPYCHTLARVLQLTHIANSSVVLYREVTNVRRVLRQENQVRATMLDPLVHHYCRSSRAKCKNWLRNWTAIFTLRCPDESCTTSVLIQINEREKNFVFGWSPDDRSHICVYQMPLLCPKPCHLVACISKCASGSFSTSTSTSSPLLGNP